MKLPARWFVLVLVSVLAGALALGAVACGDDGDDGNGDGEEPTATAPTGAEIPEVQITGTGDPGGDPYAFEAPASIEGGPTRFAFTNAAQMEDHQAQLLKLNDDVTFDDFMAAFETAESEADVVDILTFIGGPGAGPGLSNSSVVDLDAGQYVLLCLIPNPEGVPHAELGMLQELEVTEPMAEQPEAPSSDVTVGLSDFEFDAPDTLSAGEVTIAAVNNGEQAHEMALVRPAEGLTVDELLEMVLAEPDPNAPPPEGPPPFTFVGQVAVLSSGLSSQTTVDLAPGAYALVCFVTDPVSGAPHAALGMTAQFNVE